MVAEAASNQSLVLTCRKTSTRTGPSRARRRSFVIGGEYVAQFGLLFDHKVIHGWKLRNLISISGERCSLSPLHVLVHLFNWQRAYWMRSRNSTRTPDYEAKSSFPPVLVASFAQPGSFRIWRGRLVPLSPCLHGYIIISYGATVQRTITTKDLSFFFFYPSQAKETRETIGWVIRGECPITRSFFLFHEYVNWSSTELWWLLNAVFEFFELRKHRSMRALYIGFC